MVVVNNSISSGKIPIITEYPTLDITKIGKKVWYNGIIWEYLSLEKITILGLNASAGFPVPAERITIQELVFSGDTMRYYGPIISIETITFIVSDMIGFAYPNKISSVSLTPNSNYGITQIKNAQLLTNLKDWGTVKAFSIYYGQLNAVNINQFLTDLPITNNVATIDISNNPGSATCNATIATAKGYIVIK